MMKEVGPSPGVQSVQDGLRQVSIMEELAEGGQGFVGGDDHGSALEVAIVDHPIQHVSGSGALLW